MEELEIIQDNPLSAILNRFRDCRINCKSINQGGSARRIMYYS
jgi:hypothetical protein